MAKIYLTGQQKPITVSKKVGQQVATFKTDPSILPNELFQSEDFVAEKREIKSVIVNDYEDNSSERNDEVKEANDAHYANLNKDYEKHIEARCFMPIQKKAQDTRAIELVYESFTGEKAPQSFKDEVVKRQSEYYTKYPKHPYAGINFQDIMPSPRKSPEAHLAEVMPSYVLGKAMKIMAEGLSTAKKMHLI